jgi:hypothetical protein
MEVEPGSLGVEDGRSFGRRRASGGARLPARDVRGADARGDRLAVGIETHDPRYVGLHVDEDASRDEDGRRS